MVKASDSRTADPGFDSRLRRDHSRSSRTSDLKVGTPVATLPGAWRHRVSTRNGWPGVSFSVTVEGLIYNFYLSVPGVWRHRVSAWTGWPGVSFSVTADGLIYNFYVSVTTRTIV